MSHDGLRAAFCLGLGRGCALLRAGAVFAEGVDQRGVVVVVVVVGGEASSFLFRGGGR